MWGASRCILHSESLIFTLLFSAPWSPPHAEQGNYFLGVGIVQNQSSVKPTRANAECARRLGETRKCMLAMCAHRQLVMVIHRSWNEFVPRQRSRGWGCSCMGQVFPYWRCLLLFSFNSWVDWYDFKLHNTLVWGLKSILLTAVASWWTDNGEE